MKNLLKNRSTESLKQDAPIAMKEEGPAFVLILNELESRMDPKEYEEFENSL